MNPSRRAILLGGVALLSGCAGSPLVVAPEGALRIVEEEPVQHPDLATASTLIAAVRAAVEGQPAGGWRDGALAQCDEQLARFGSVDPFGDSDAVFPAAEAQTTDLPTAIAEAVEGLAALATSTDAEGHSLLFTSAAAATHALANQQSIPGEGASPSHVQPLAAQRENALSHVWALISALELSLANIEAKDPLREQITQRLRELRTLRGILRDAEDADPSQPPFFELPDMTTPMAIATSWAQLEVDLAEALVLLAAQERRHHDLWLRQVEAAQALGGQIPRWPGWD